MKKDGDEGFKCCIGFRGCMQEGCNVVWKKALEAVNALKAVLKKVVKLYEEGFKCCKGFRGCMEEGCNVVWKKALEAVKA